MTLDALKQIGNNVWDTAAPAVKSWIKDSPSIYAATAASYAASYYGNLHGIQLLKGLEATSAAKITFLAFSAGSAIRGLFQQDKPTVLTALKNKNPIIFTNALAIAWAISSRWKIQTPVLPTIAVISAAAAAAKASEWLFEDKK